MGAEPSVRGGYREDGEMVSGEPGVDGQCHIRRLPELLRQDVQGQVNYNWHIINIKARRQTVRRAFFACNRCFIVQKGLYLPPCSEVMEEDVSVYTVRRISICFHINGFKSWYFASPDKGQG